MKPLRSDILDILFNYLQANGGFKSRLRERMQLKVDSSNIVHWSSEAYDEIHGESSSSLSQNTPITATPSGRSLPKFKMG